MESNLASGCPYRTLEKKVVLEVYKKLNVTESTKSKDILSSKNSGKMSPA